MRKIEQIERQLEGLSGAEFTELRNWLLEKDWRAWDAQIEADSKNGKLDAVLADARADFAAGRSREL